MSTGTLTATESCPAPVITADSFRALSGKTAISLALRVLGAGATFFAQWLLARQIGADQFGEVMLIMTWMNVLVLVAKCGFDGLTLRLIASPEMQANVAQRQRFLRLRSACTMSIGLSLIASGIVALVVIGDRWGTALRLATLVMLFIVPATAWLEHFSAELRAHRQLAQADFCMWMARPLIWLLLCVPLAWAPSMRNVPVVMGLLGVSTIAALLAARFVRPNRFTNGLLAADSTDRHDPHWLKAALFTSVSAAFTLLLTQSDILLIGALLDPTSAGVYAVAVRMAALVSMGLVAINGVSAASLAHLSESGDTVGLRRMVGRIALLSSAFSFPATLACWILAQVLLPQFGGPFASAGGPLLWLLLGQVANTFCGPVATLAAMSGREALLARVLGLVALLNLILQPPLIYMWGITGAAIATCLSMVGWNVLLAIVMHRELGFDPTLCSLLKRWPSACSEANA